MLRAAPSISVLMMPGNVVGVKNVKKLLEDVPNKIQTSFGIVADVNKLTKDRKDYLEIKVKPSSFPNPRGCL